MKVRLTVTVEIDDPYIYTLDWNGWANGPPEGKIDREDVGNYVTEAISYWGGQFAPDDPFFSRNIKSVRVRGTDFDILNER